MEKFIQNNKISQKNWGIETNFGQNRCSIM